MKKVPEKKYSTYEAGENRKVFTLSDVKVTNTIKCYQISEYNLKRG